MNVGYFHSLLLLSLVAGTRSEGSLESDSTNVASLLDELEQKLSARIANLQETVNQQAKLLTDQESENNLLKEAISALDSKLAALEEKLEQASLHNGSSSPSTELILNKIPRTCEELRNLNPLARSGTYTLDPDGHGNGEEPIQAYCNMTTGTTEIDHDNLEATAVSRCSARGCFSKTIKYSASMNQLAALINLSKICKQKIQYDCITAPFEFKNRNYAWWNDRNGVSHYTWAGDNATLEHTCDCGLRNACVDPTLKCNCDALAPELQTDYGYITDMSSLPVTKVSFGRVLYSSSKGVFTLGKLECSGKHQLKSQPVSCEDLWRAGNTFSGVYTLKAKNGFDAAFCDFSKVPNESGFETRIGTAGIQTSEVVFKVHIDTTVGNPGTKLTAGKIITNEGSSFKSDHFEAPVDGIYSFYFKAWNDRSHYATTASLRRNNQDTKILGQVTNYGEELSFTGVLDLKAGDQVSVVLVNGKLKTEADPDRITEFGGILIKQFPTS